MTVKPMPVKKRAPMKSLPVRRTVGEAEAIKKLAKRAGLSEARLMVIASLMLAEFGTEEELRAAVQIGGQLWQARSMSLMQVRRIGHQLERLREETGGTGEAERRERLDAALEEVASVLRGLGVKWWRNARSQK